MSGGHRNSIHPQPRGTRRRRPCASKLLVAGLLAAGAAALVVAIVAQEPHQRAVTAFPFARVLGAPPPRSALVWRPARDVTVQIGHRGYGVAAAPDGTLSVTRPLAGGASSGIERGVRNATPFGSETIAVLLKPVEAFAEFAAVGRHQPPSTWSWRIATSGLRPVERSDGSIAFVGRGVGPLRMPAVRILERRGAGVTSQLGSVLYVDNTNPFCLDTGGGTQVQPFCTIGAAAAKVTAGQTVQVAGTTYAELVKIARSGTPTQPIVFTAAPGSSPTVTGATNGFSISGQSYVTVEGFNITRATGDGIYVKNSTNVDIVRNHVSYNGQPVLNETARGIRFANVDNSVVEDNTVDHNTAYGIYVDAGSTGVLVSGNTSFANAFGYQRAASGIRIHSSSGNTITGNVSRDNEDSGIDLDKSTDNVVSNNLFSNNGDHGIDVTASSFRTTVTGNTVYGSFTAGINVEGTSTAAIANNISVDNGIASTRTHGDIRVDNGSTDGTTMDYDEVFLTSPDTLLIWGGTSYTSLSAFRAATGQETHGIQAAPKWSNPTGGDFHLTAGSPAIDSANSSAPGQTAADVEHFARVDDPTTPDTGVGARTYDDRGAYEYHAHVLDHIVVSPGAAVVAAGNAQVFEAEGFDAANNDLGDVTGSTTFTVAPDGSCTRSSCKATTSGAHTVTASIAGATATASLTVQPGPLDHLALSPASATITSRGSLTYVAAGRDQYDNSLGDVTSATTLTIAPDGSCAGATCTASKAGTHTVTGTDSTATGSATLQVTAGTRDHIVIAPASATIAAGGSQTYTAQSFDSSGNLLADVTSSTTFSIAPNGACTANVCAATKVGAHTVTGVDNGQTSTASLTVTAGPPDHLSVSPASATIGSGSSQTYTAEALDQYDNELGDVTSSTTFTIAPDGSCAGTSCSASLAGTHTVTGTSGSLAGTAQLQVVASALVATVAISPASATIAAGASQTYTAQGYDASGNSIGDVTSSTTFSIGPDGSCTGNTCTATAAGSHQVTGTAGSGTGAASLTVTGASVDHLVVSPSTATISAGGSQAYTAAAFDRYGNALGDATANTTFTIAPDGSCTSSTCTATVDGGHTVTGTSVGAVGTATLTVSSTTVDHIVVSPGSASIVAGGSQAYTAAAFDASGVFLGDVTGSTSFSIAPDGSCAGNVCSATVAGAHTVTGTSGGKTASASLAVSAGAVDHLALSPASATIGPGGSQAYTAQARDRYDNSLGDVTAATTFAISPDGSCSGATCTASAAGVHTVTGTDAGQAGTASLQVSSGTLDHIVIGPATATITAGGSQAYTAKGYDANGNPLGDVTSSTTFTILPDGSCAGATCTATVAGGHTVTGSDAGKTSSATLTVTAGALDHLALSPATTAIAAGGSQAYLAQGRDRYDNSLGDLTTSTTFAIAPDGSCAGATCTATVAGAHAVIGSSVGATGTASLQVNAAALDHISLSPATATIPAGTSQTYSAAGFDQYGNALGDLTGSTTFTIAPDGSCTGAGCTTTAGGSHTVTGANNGKTAIATLAVDFVKNPGFESDLSGWNTSGSGANVTFARVAGGHSGSWAAQLTNTATAATTFATLQDSPNWVATTKAGTYTGSIWVKADAAGAVLKLKLQEYSGSTLVGSASSQVTLSTSWQQVTATYAVKSPGSTLDFQAYVANPAPGTAFYADDASILLG